MRQARRTDNELGSKVRRVGIRNTNKAVSICVMLMIFLVAATANGARFNVPGAATVGGTILNIQQPVIPKAGMHPLVIPPLRERPLDVKEGPKIIVKHFELKGVVERPGLISVTEVEELVEKQRREWPAGMTMGQMQLVADEVTNYYRNHGLILAKAYMEAQTVTNDVVKITVLEGKLGAVHSEGGVPVAASADLQKTVTISKLRYSEEILQRPFLPLVGQVIVKDDLEGALFQLYDYPGLKYNAVIKPGTELGTADLYLNVTEERFFNALLSVDNYGSDYTGKYRPRLDLIFNNPTKAADKLSVTLIDTVQPNNELYGGVSYERPLPWDQNSLGIDYSRNAFDVGGGLEELKLAGTADIRDVFIKHSFKRSRKGSVSGKFMFTSLTAETSMLDVTTAEDDLSIVSADFEVADYLDQWLGGGVTNMNVRISRGIPEFLGSNSNNDVNTSRVGESGDKAPTDFSKLNAEYTRLQKLWTNGSLLFRLQGQATDSMLVSIEQLALGGPDTVRAYPQAEYMMDQGYSTSFEFLFNAPGFASRPAFLNRTWGELLQVSLFYDTAEGWLKDPLANEKDSGRISGAGIGIYFTLPGRFVASLSVAKPINKDESVDISDYQTYFKISFLY